MLQRFGGLLLLLSGLALLWFYPVGTNGLLALALVLVVAQWRDQHSWLLTLPLLLACVDLVPWSGWLLIDEFDGLLAVLAGTALLAGQYAGSGVCLRRGVFWLWMLALVLAIGLQRGLFPLPPLDANAWYGYLTNWNAVRVARGGWWALLFAPLLLRQSNDDRSAVEKRLALGLTLSMIAFGAYVLWQRGLLIDLMTAQDRRGLFANWLDMAGKYRITGTFSQMHLGGEAVDTFLILVWPYAFWLLLQSRQRTIALLTLLALGLASYAVMVTFTRTTYLAAGLAFVVYLGMLLCAPHLHSRWPLLAGGAFVLFCGILSWFGFRQGGTLLLLGNMVVISGGLVLGSFRTRLSKRLLLAGIASLMSVGVALALRGMLTSRWVDTSLALALAIAFPSILLFALGGLAVGHSFGKRFGVREALTASAIVSILLPIAVIALSGYQMQARSNTVGEDWALRTAHWRKTAALVPDNLVAQTFGRGLGAFPRANLLEGVSQESGWFISPQGPLQVLRLIGNSSLAMGQRLLAPATGQYRFSAQVRNPGRAPASLEIRLQPRRLLEMDGWLPNSTGLEFKIKPGQSFEKLEGVIDIEPANIPRWFDPRTLVFALTNSGFTGSALDLADIRLNDAQGNNTLRNGDFSAGGKYWLAYSDFFHLDWHVQSIYVATFFESGYFGLGVWLALVALAVWRSFRSVRRGETFGAASVAAIAGFLVLGLTGTLNDTPRIMTLFLLLCTAALWFEERKR